MACYNLGDYICESRKQLGITQEELAFGICSTGTLSNPYHKHFSTQELYQKLKTDLWYQSGKIMKLLCSVLERQ